jgi:hypothetical protein
MARITKPVSYPPTRIDKFLGLNEDTTGETQLTLGESPNMLNYRISENFKLRKREGYYLLKALLVTEKITGMWYGKLNGEYCFLIATATKVYEYSFATKLFYDKGTLTSCDHVTFFQMGDAVYLLNGHDYLASTGASFLDVVAYTPTVAINAPPEGGGTLYEDVNMLSDYRKMSFSPTAAGDIVFHLAETNIASVTGAKINGVAAVVKSVDIAAGTATVTVTEADLTEGSVVITWRKGTSDKAIIQAMKYATFYNGASDARVFLYGDGTNKAYYSGLANGVPSAGYFPAGNFITVGADNYAITGMIPQFSKLMIFKEDSAYFSNYDILTDVTGVDRVNFPVYNMNHNIGNTAYGQVRLIRNNPFTTYKGVREWSPRDVRDEANELLVSKRVQYSLDNVDLSTATTFDYEERWEYWLCVGKDVWVYNYRLDVWYKYTLYDAPTCFIVIDKKLYFGTSAGNIMCFDSAAGSDNGQLIPRRWEMHFYAWDRESNYKTMNRAWITIKPETRTGVTISYQTDVSGKSSPQKVYYAFATYLHANYAHWSYKTNYNPQPFALEVDTEPFVYFKVILTNDNAEENETILSISLGAKISGEVN